MILTLGGGSKSWISGIECPASYTLCQPGGLKLNWLSAVTYGGFSVACSQSLRNGSDQTSTPLTGLRGLAQIRPTHRFQGEPSVASLSAPWSRSIRRQCPWQKLCTSGTTAIYKVPQWINKAAQQLVEAILHIVRNERQSMSPPGHEEGLKVIKCY